MLDRYTRGRACRTSQEASVMVLEVENREHRLGGASNVCLMLKTLDAHVSCVGVTGRDNPGETLRKLLANADIETNGVIATSQRRTTLKERFVGQSGSGPPSQVLRVDTETTTPLDSKTESQLIDVVRQAVTAHDVVLISDYDKGVCTPKCIETVIQIARQNQIPVLVDPGRGRNFELYRGATLIKPNRPETEIATNSRIQTPKEALRAGSRLCQEFGVEMAVVTLDADGIALVQRNGNERIFPTRARSVFDITGAGDMVLSMLGFAIGGGLDPEQAVQLANVAAGLEVDRSGVTVLSRDEIRTELQSHQLNSRRKIVELNTLVRLTEDYRLRGHRIVLTNGCFDLLHVGHATYLEEAASHGDTLIVAINSDASVRRLKGETRPIISQDERAKMLAALECVDHVVVFEDATPHTLLSTIRPDVLVKGGNYHVNEVVGREIIESYGGQVRVTDIVQGVSTTEILKSVQIKGQHRKAG